MNFATFEFAASVGWVGAKRHHFSINIKWIVAGQRTCKNGFPAIFALCPQDRAVWLWPPCVRCPCPKGTRPSYLNGSTPTLL
jgi:hypothetical protein